MRKRKKHCLICKISFDPNHRLGSRQVTCGSPACRKDLKGRYDSNWHWKNRELHNKAVADWFREHPIYMRDYMRRLRRGNTPVKKVPILSNPMKNKGKPVC